MEAQISLPATIRLAAHERHLSLARIHHQIYDHLRALGKQLSGPEWSCFPFCAHDRPSDWHRSWPRMGDFRDDLVAGLLQTPPSNDSECANIKQLLAGDLESRRQMFSAQAMGLVGEGLAVANQIVDDWERALTASPSRPLSKDDMHYYACVEIRSRIQRMLDADAANERLIVSSVKSEKVVMLDDLVAWAVSHGITVEQGALRNCCPPFVDASYQRVHQQSSDVPFVVADANDGHPDSLPGTKEEKREEGKELNVADWIIKARYHATEYIKRHRAQDLFPTQRDVCDHVEKILRQQKIYGPHGKPLSSKYIRREAIQGQWWRENKP